MSNFRFFGSSYKKLLTFFYIYTFSHLQFSIVKYQNVYLKRRITMSSSKFAIFCIVLFSFVSLHEGMSSKFRFRSIIYYHYQYKHNHILHYVLIGLFFIFFYIGFNHRHLLAVPRPCSPTANGKWCCYPSGFAYCNDSQRRCEKQCKALP